MPMTPASFLGPNGTYCMPMEWYQHVVSMDDAIKVAGGCFMLGVLWAFIIIYLIKRYRRAPA
jgi:hypothetical protein